jgi:hypothetical protein
LERYLIAKFIKRAIVRFVSLAAIARWMHVGLPAPYKDAVQAVEKGVDVSAGCRGEDARDCFGDNANHIDRDVWHRIQLLIASDYWIGEDANYWAATADRPLTAPTASTPVKAKSYRVRSAAILKDRVP